MSLLRRARDCYSTNEPATATRCVLALVTWLIATQRQGERSQCSPGRRRTSGRSAPTISARCRCNVVEFDRGRPTSKRHLTWLHMAIGQAEKHLSSLQADMNVSMTSRPLDAVSKMASDRLNHDVRLQVLQPPLFRE